MHINWFKTLFDFQRENVVELTARTDGAASTIEILVADNNKLQKRVEELLSENKSLELEIEKLRPE